MADPNAAGLGSTVHVVAKRDFLESLAAARPIAALAELIWNGFDAEATSVDINLDYNELGGLECIRVKDNGTGIDHTKLPELFGSLGDSWKKRRGRINGRAMHGKSGKGRFKAFALGQLIEWSTTYRSDGHAYTYTIRGDASALDDFEVSEVSLTDSAGCGTEVSVYNIRSAFRSLQSETAPIELAKIFAAYLTEYPGIELTFDGVRVDPRTVQDLKTDYLVSQVELADNRKLDVAVSIIEWNIDTDRTLHLCDASGVTLLDVEVGPSIRAPGFNFTVYVKTDYFRDLDTTNQLALPELHPDVQQIIKAVRAEVRDHFRRRLAEQQSQIVERWKKEQIYPYEDKPTLDPIEEAERQVFDIVAVNVQSYLPHFEDTDHKSRKFTFRLLAQALRENPDSVQEIVAEVLGLRKEAQDELAALLRKTPLASIISSARVVADRLDFLMGLESLLFDPDNKRRLLERDQLHKILEKEAWLFNEEFSLAGSEERLEEVLNKHLADLGVRKDSDAPVTVPDGSGGRIDLMFHKVVQPRNGEYDYLIVELKRPSQKINADVLNQIEKYAMAVASDERFNGIKCHWTFVAVANDLDEHARRRANQRGAPRWRTYDDAVSNITVWAMPWAEVINDARSRLRFYNDQLAYEADRGSAKAYLRKAHAKFVPPSVDNGPAEPQ